MSKCGSLGGGGGRQARTMSGIPFRFIVFSFVPQIWTRIKGFILHWGANTEVAAGSGSQLFSAPFFPFSLVAAPPKMVFPKKGSLFFQGH